MTKIFIVVNNAWYAYNFRLNLAKFLTKNGYKVAFVMPFDEKYTLLLKSEFEVFNIYFDAKGINPLVDLKTVFELFRLYRKTRPQMVLNFTIKPNLYSSVAARILGIKSISNITGLGTIFVKENLITKLAEILYKVALKKNSMVFFQNGDDAGLFLNRNLVARGQIKLLPGSGVDTGKFSPQVLEKSDEFTFLFIARLIKDKGVCELIDAAKELSKKYKFKLWLLGEKGVQNNTAVSDKELNSWLKSDFISYLGKTDDVREYIARCDCVVLPSYREGTPRSLLEAAAMAKPIVTTNVAGCKEVVEHGFNGLLCEVKNSGDLADKMGQILNLSGDELEKMGQNGREKITREFDEKIVLKEYLAAVKA